MIIIKYSLSFNLTMKKTCELKGIKKIHCQVYKGET